MRSPDDGATDDSWRAPLAKGDPQAAWNHFDARYRRLILATIKRLVPDSDDRMDVFGTVCERLSADDCARLRSYSPARGASTATWLVAVVRNLTVDWLRRRDGRARTSVPAGLTDLQRGIYESVCFEGASHVEAYEVLRLRTGSAMPFPEFLRHARETQRLVPCPERRPARLPDRPAPALDGSVAPVDAAETSEAAARLAAVLNTQPADVRLAVQLFVVEDMAAAEVARVVGWPGPKAVYNRVYRALASMRSEFERAGLRRIDL